jgi:hypothetical protein
MPAKNMTIDSRLEYLGVQRPRYLGLNRKQKGELLDEMEAVTGLCRQVLIRRMRPTDPLKRRKRRRERTRTYGSAEVMAVLRVIAEAHDYIGAGRLWPELLPMAEHLERHGELHLTPGVVRELSHMSLSTLKRLLSRVRQDECHLLRRHPSEAPPWRQGVPMRRIPWNTQEPGHFEVDLVHHCGPSATGDYVHTIMMVDVATGWVEPAAALGRSFRAISHGFQHIQERVPFRVLEAHPDNGVEFFNDHMARFWPKLFPDVDLSRSRPYHKNDNRFVEEKNARLVRAYLGYDRLDTVRHTLALDALYDLLWLYTNFFQPVMRLCSKQVVTADDGSQKIIREYDRARTPLQRLAAGGVLPPDRLRQLEQLRLRTNPRRLRQQIHQAIGALFSLPNATPGVTEDVLATLDTTNASGKEEGSPATLSVELTKASR